LENELTPGEPLALPTRRDRKRLLIDA